jgi:hypothetical protein
MHPMVHRNILRGRNQILFSLENLFRRDRTIVEFPKRPSNQLIAGTLFPHVRGQRCTRRLGGQTIGPSYPLRSSRVESEVLISRRYPYCRSLVLTRGGAGRPGFANAQVKRPTFHTDLAHPISEGILPGFTTARASRVVGFVLLYSPSDGGREASVTEILGYNGDSMSHDWAGHTGVYDSFVRICTSSVAFCLFVSL